MWCLRCQERIKPFMRWGSMGHRSRVTGQASDAACLAASDGRGLELRLKHRNHSAHVERVVLLDQRPGM